MKRQAALPAIHRFNNLREEDSDCDDSSQEEIQIGNYENLDEVVGATDSCDSIETEDIDFPPLQKQV